jgi:predicted transposase YbfD/YdcC
MAAARCCSASDVYAGLPTVKHRYFISSLKSDAKLLHLVRTHWGIENELHGVPIWPAVTRGPRKCSLRGKRKKAAWDEQYLLRVLTGEKTWP